MNWVEGTLLWYGGTYRFLLWSAGYKMSGRWVKKLFVSSSDRNESLERSDI